MKIIKRLVIEPKKDPIIIRVAENAEFLTTIAYKDKEILLFAIVNSEDKVIEYEVHCIESGELIEDRLEYIDTVALHRGVFEFHVFIRKKL